MSLDIQAALARCKAATKGQWWKRFQLPEDDLVVLGPPDDEHGGDVVIAQAYETADAEFIAHARSDLPAALEALEEAQAELSACTRSSQ